MKYSNDVLLAATTLLSVASAMLPGAQIRKPGMKKTAQITKRQLPPDAVGVQSVTGPSGVNITFKDPGAEVSKKDAVAHTFADHQRAFARPHQVSNRMQGLSILHPMFTHL